MNKETRDQSAIARIIASKPEWWAGQGFPTTRSERRAFWARCNRARRSALRAERRAEQGGGA